MAATKPAHLHEIGTFVARTKASCMALAFIIEDPAAMSIFAHFEAMWIMLNEQFGE